MDESLAHEILNELISYLEPLETQSAALLQFVKDKGIASDEELAPYLKQAGNASSVRWRAFRVRMEALISSALKPSEPEQKVDVQKQDAEEKRAASKAAGSKKENRGREATRGPDQEAQPSADSVAKPAAAGAKTQTPEQETKRQPEKDAA